MGDRMMELEERLEQLVPRGLSEDGRARMDAEIDRLAAEVADDVPTVSSGGRFRKTLAWAAVACVLVSLTAVYFAPPAATVDQPVVEVVAPYDAEAALIEYLASELRVTEMRDHGWGIQDGSDQAYRYWTNMVTETENMLDHESGYEVKVVSEREVVVPVALTYL